MKILHWYQPALIRCPPQAAGLGADFSAGLLVGIVALPLAIAFAIASGAPPVAGLVTGVVAGVIIALAGGSRFQVGGPTGAFVGLCATTIATYGTAGLALATVMAGILLIVIALLRLGAVIRLIPAPVIIGFTSGIAVVIASTQLRDACGISDWPSQPPGHFHERLSALWAGLSSWNPWALGFCLCTISGMVLLRRLRPTWPGALIVIVVGTVLAQSTTLPLTTIGDRFGVLPGSLPWPSLSVFGGLEIHSLADLLARMSELSGTAFAIGLLAAIESLLSATVADGMGKDRHDSDSELMGQGFANIMVPFFGGLPATGAIARTATNIRAGAVSPLAAAFHALTLLALLLLATPLVRLIPLASLAAVLLVVAWHMSEIHHWGRILRGKHTDAVLLPLTFLLTVFIDLTVAVEVGVVLGMFFFVRRLSNATEIRAWGASESTASLLAPEGLPPEVEVFEVSGPFFFGMTMHLRNLLDGLGPHRRVLVLRMRHVPFVDATAAATLHDLLEDCHEQQRHLILSGVVNRCRVDLQRYGIEQALGANRICPTLREALELAKTCATSS